MFKCLKSLRAEVCGGCGSSMLKSLISLAEVLRRLTPPKGETSAAGGKVSPRLTGAVLER